MTIEQLIQTDLIRDDTTVVISKPLSIPGQYLTQKGNWYQDQILDFSDCVISKLTYIRAENKVYVEVGDPDVW